MKRCFTRVISGILTSAMIFSCISLNSTAAFGADFIPTTADSSSTAFTFTAADSNSTPAAFANETIVQVSEAAMPKDKITLYGDDAFKAEILQGSNDEIAANALYVAANGNDANDGSLDKPFLTVQRALDVVKAGQTIYVREGTYSGHNTFKTSGSEGSYITLRNYPGEKPMLTASGDGAIIGTAGCKYLKIEGFEIGKAASSGEVYGILLNADENHIIIRNNDIHDMVTTDIKNGNSNAILVYAEGKTEDTAIHNICIENNKAHDNETGWCESVSVAGNAKYCNIINNAVYNNTNIGIDFYGNAGYCPVPTLDQPRYCVAAGNTVYSCVSSIAESAGLYVDGARDIVFEHNISHNNSYGIEIGSEEGGKAGKQDVKNIVVRNNLVYGNNYGGIRVGGWNGKVGAVKDTKIYNNTLITNDTSHSYGEICIVKCDGIDIKNNMAYTTAKSNPVVGGDVDGAYILNVRFNNNVFYSPAGAEEIYFEFARKSSTGIDAFNTQVGGTNYYGKPDFNTNYSLKAGSFGIDLGADVGSDMGSLIDLGNNSRIINTIDVGAFEYQDGSDPVIPPSTESTTEVTTTEITTTEGTTSDQGGTPPTSGSGYTHNFDEYGTSSDFYTIVGNLSKKGTVTYNGLTLEQCLKMESATSISFNAPKAGKLTLVFGGSTAPAGKSVKIDNEKCTVAADGTYTIDLEAGTHTVTKGDSIFLYYMSFDFEGAPEGSTATTESEFSTEATTASTTEAVKESTTAPTTSEENPGGNSDADQVSPVYMPKDKITLYGDDAFKAEILKDSDNAIAPNALYVAANGNDANDGSLDKPFLTVQKALDVVKAGQTIYVRKGTYSAHNTFKTSGSEGNYITLRNYPGEKPMLTAKGDGAIIGTEGCDYIKIEGLEIGNLSAVTAYGILLNGDENHIIIRNNDIHHLATTKPGESGGGEANAILCYAEGKTEETAINNICIENNKVHDNTTGWCESVSVTGNAKYINIINNNVYNNTNIGIDFYGNAGYCSVKTLDQPRYGVAAGNTVSKSICPYAESAGLYVDGARDIILEHNMIYDSAYGIEIGSEEGGRSGKQPVTNIIARNNLVYNNYAGGIRIGGYDTKNTGYVTNTKVYNNTMVNNHQDPSQGDGGWNGDLCIVKCDGIDIKNNIIYKDESAMFTEGGESKILPVVGGDLAATYVKNVKLDNNVFYVPVGADAMYFEYDKKERYGLNQLNTDFNGTNLFGKVELNADYSLKENSYGIDLGTDVSADLGALIDLANKSRVVNKIDVGAFEYQTGTVEPPVKDPKQLMGDADYSGVLTANDSAEILMKTLDGSYITNLEKNVENGKIYLDLNEDEAITAADAAQVLNLVLNP